MPPLTSTAHRRGAIAWPTLLLVALPLAAAGGFFWWRMRVESVDADIEAKQGALKNLRVAGKLPPTPQVKAYLEQRSDALRKQYDEALSVATVPMPITEDAADPQLYFQQRLHEVQTALQQLATAQGLPAPSILGLPKELPPADVTPRLLLQLDLIHDVAETLSSLKAPPQMQSFKVGDPEPLPPAGEEPDGFLVRLPVRVRLTGSLSSLTQALAVIEHATPWIELRSLRMGTPVEKKAPAEKGAAEKGTSAPATPAPAPEPSDGPPPLDAEMDLARYLSLSPLDAAIAGASADSAAKPSAKPSAPVKR